jgi:multidrug efflux system outer membrane protein
MRHAHLSSVAGIAAVLALGACMVGPDYTPPAIETRPGYVETPPEGPAAAPDGDGLWWHALQDPTLESLVQAAELSSYDLRVAAARVLETQALRSGAQAEQFPNIEAVGSATRLKDSGNTFFKFDGSDDTRSQYVVGAQGSWELDFWGRVRRAVEAADADLAAAHELLRDAQRLVVASVASEYVELRGAERELAVARRNIESQRDTLQLTESLVAEGLGNHADVARARGLLRETESTIPLLEARVAGNLHRLTVLTGLDATVLKQRLAEPDALPETPITPDLGVPADLLRKRPDVRAAERELAAATARIGVATGDLFPRITLDGRFAFDSTEASTLFQNDSISFGVGPALRWPLLDFGRVRARIAAEGARQESALASYERTVAQAISEVEIAVASLRSRGLSRAVLAEAVAANRESAQLIDVRFRAGAVSFLEVLDAQRRVLLVEAELARAQTELLLDFVALNRALGARVELPPPAAQDQPTQ